MNERTDGWITVLDSVGKRNIKIRSCRKWLECLPRRELAEAVRQVDVPVGRSGADHVRRVNKYHGGAIELKTLLT